MFDQGEVYFIANNISCNFMFNNFLFKQTVRRLFVGFEIIPNRNWNNNITIKITK